MTLNPTSPDVTHNETHGLEGLVQDVVSQHGLVCESITTRPGSQGVQVDIVIDLPEDEIGSVDLDTVAEVSRALSERLDDDESILGSGPYTLDVGTPGAERRLTELRHWKRARTRLVNTRFADGTTLRTRVADVSDDGTLRLYPEREVDDRGRRIPLPKGTPDVLTPSWTEVESAQVLIEFHAPDPRVKEN